MKRMRNVEVDRSVRKSRKSSIFFARFSLLISVSARLFARLGNLFFLFIIGYVLGN